MTLLAVALDLPTLDEADSLASSVAGVADVFKVGLELFVAYGPDAVRQIQKHGPVFCDLKIHDIPRTASAAVSAAAGLGVEYLTVHASGGAEMLGACAEVAGDTTLLGVTVLTSLDDSALLQIGYARSASDSVTSLAQLCRDSGVNGLVCSPNELAAVGAASPGMFLVSPGVRPTGSDPGDQKRVATPKAAATAGASMIVVGRPITRAADPRAAAEAIKEELS